MDGSVHRCNKEGWGFLEGVSWPQLFEAELFTKSYLLQGLVCVLSAVL